MNLFDKINLYTDYKDSYSVKKALTTLGREFGLAVVKKNVAYAQEVINTVHKLRERLSQTINTQGVNIKQVDRFVAYLTWKLKKDFGAV